MAGEARLNRTLSLPLITFYGIGTILGAGIYVLIGKVAAAAGIYAPISFLLAAVVAAFSGCSYAEMSSRFPKSAGEAVYVLEGFNWLWLSTLVGWLVVMTGVVSSATICNGFVGYLHLFFHVPDNTAITLLALGMGLLAIWGIKESVTVVTVITLMEIGGLILVLFAVGDSLLTLPQRWHELVPAMQSHAWMGIGLGGFLAFYAFIGFEDMINCAEEVIEPKRNLPLSIIIALVICSFLYVLVALVAVLSLGPEQLSASRAPLADVMHDAAGYNPALIGIISLVAVVNGALVQIIMASRVIYGMGLQKSAPRFLSVINHTTHTPINATVLVTVVVLALALWFPLVTLAKATSYIILTVFSLVNLSLIRVKRRVPEQDGAVHYPMFVPIIGFVLCCGLLALQTFG